MNNILPGWLSAQSSSPVRPTTSDQVTDPSCLWNRQNQIATVESKVRTYYKPQGFLQTPKLGFRYSQFRDSGFGVLLVFGLIVLQEASLIKSPLELMQTSLICKNMKHFCPVFNLTLLLLVAPSCTLFFQHRNSKTILIFPLNPTQGFTDHCHGPPYCSGWWASGQQLSRTFLPQPFWAGGPEHIVKNVSGLCISDDVFLVLLSINTTPPNALPG